MTAPAGQKLDELTCWKGGILYGPTLKVTELVFLWRLHGCLLNFLHLSATGMAEIAEDTNLKRCLHTFVYIVYFISNSDLDNI